MHTDTLPGLEKIKQNNKRERKENHQIYQARNVFFFFFGWAGEYRWEVHVQMLNCLLRKRARVSDSVFVCVVKTLVWVPGKILAAREKGSWTYPSLTTVRSRNFYPESCCLIIFDKTIRLVRGAKVCIENIYKTFRPAPACTGFAHL